ncbi:MAG TPA: CoA ester lyase [Pseudonocardiaceae bacterium]|nr:CoA ester lyase [Pseudonocardiaceae bacterium]
MTTHGLARSYLYVPGDRPDRLAGALTRGADALIADLEDAVGPGHKRAAREHVRAWLDLESGDGPQRWVRINADTVDTDLDAVVTTALTGVVVPKSEPARLDAVDTVLGQLEAERGLAAGSVAVLPLLESGLGIQRVAEVAAAPRVLRLGVGEVDLASDLGLTLDAERTILNPLRLSIVVASAAAGISRPVAPTSTAFRDLETFRRSAETLRRMGFRGRTAIHPGQLSVIHDVFTPSEDEIAAARDLLTRFDAADGGGFVHADGTFADLANIRNARETLALAGQR